MHSERRPKEEGDVMNEEYEVKMSSLCQPVTRDGVTVQVNIKVADLTKVWIHPADPAEARAGNC